MKLRNLPVALFAFVPIGFSSIVLAQDLAWEVDSFTPNRPVAEPGLLLSTPAGGVVELTRSGVTEEDAKRRIQVTYRNENGDQSWRAVYPTVNPPAAILEFAGRSFDAAVDSAGDLYLLARSANASTRLHRIAPDGTTRWSQTLTGPFDYRGKALAIAPSGDVIVAGTYGSPDLYPRHYVQAFDPQGSPLWTFEGADSGAPQSHTANGDAVGVSVADNGDIAVFGAHDFDFGGAGPLPQVLCLNADGTRRWSRIPVVLNGVMTRLEAAPSGGWVGLASVGFEFSAVRARVVGVDPSSGAMLWGASLGDSATASDMALDSSGSIYVSTTVPRAAGGADLAVQKLSPSGTILWTATPSIAQGLMESTAAAGVDVDGDSVVLVGSLGDLGGQTPAASLVAEFDAAGAERWAIQRDEALSGPTSELSSVDVARDPRGNLFVLSTGRRSASETTVNLVKLVRGGAAGTVYCSPAQVNSTGAPGVLEAFGSDARVANNITLRASALPPGVFSFALASRTQDFVPLVPGSQGALCLGGSIGRYVGPGQVRQVDGAGLASLQIDLDTIPQPTGAVSGVVGETWNFQVWYRDANPMPTSNFTDGVSVVMQ